MKFGKSINMTWEILFLKVHIKNVAEKLVPDSFMKNQNWANICIHSLKCYKFVFIISPSQDPPKYIKAKLLVLIFAAWVFKKNIYLVMFY